MQINLKTDLVRLETISTLASSDFLTPTIFHSCLIYVTLVVWWFGQVKTLCDSNLFLS